MPDYQPGVTLITCTGDRAEAFELCRDFIGRQTYRGPLQWIIVNDGVYMVAHMGFPHWPSGRGVETRIFPEPKWRPGQNTLARNLLAAIPEVWYDKVLFVEDDDHYEAGYVEVMAAHLDDASIVGDPVSHYYHLPSRRRRSMQNHGTASLCQTGIRAELLPCLARICRNAPDFIDYRLWQDTHGERGSKLPRLDLVVGMKGLPGRPGIGVGHRPERNPEHWTADPDLSVLREWIGDDVELYRPFLEPACQAAK